MNPLTNFGMRTYYPYRKPQPQITIEPEEMDIRTVAEKSAQLRTDALTMCLARRKELEEQRDGIIDELEKLAVEIAALESAEYEASK